MKAQKTPMLPMITPRGQGNLSARDAPLSHRQPMGPALSSRSPASKFNRLKGVLVNNLLKYYHQRTNKQGNDQVYALAVEEVEQILRHGKLQEKHLKELQRRFANGVGLPAGDRDLGAGVKKNSSGGDAGQGTEHDKGVKTNGIVNATPNADGLSTANGSPNKKQRKVDEWSVMLLYNDVKQLEAQSKLKEKQAAEKHKAREDLLGQIEMRKRMKEEQRASERRAADEQRKRYEAWVKVPACLCTRACVRRCTLVRLPTPYTLHSTSKPVIPSPFPSSSHQEKEVLEQRKAARIAEERQVQSVAKMAAEEKKKLHAQARLKEEQKAIAIFHEQIEQVWGLGFGVWGLKSRV
jgi:hypothetical protein